MQIFSKNLRADLIRMQGTNYINISGNTINTTQNLIFTQASQHTLDQIHFKVGPNDLV